MDVDSDTDEDMREQARRARFGKTIYDEKHFIAGLVMPSTLMFASSVSLENNYKIFEHISREAQPAHSLVTVTMQPYGLIEGHEYSNITLRDGELEVTDSKLRPMKVGALRTGKYMMRMTVRRVDNNEMWVLYRPVDLEI